MRRLSTCFSVLILCALLMPHTANAASNDDETLPSFPIINGAYFSQAAGDDPAMGYTITDDDGIAFYTTFRRLGGVTGVGFPASGRFMFNGFVSQATQKAIFQWNPARGDVDLVNVFDVLSQAGLDGWLQAQKQTPPSFDNSADAGKSWDQVVARHQAELDWNPAIKARYFADSDPMSHFGLPQSYADEGNVLVVRCQRAVFQQWKVNVPWAQAGEVTIANGGDIAKDANLLPAAATKPASARGLIATPLFRGSFPLTNDQINAVRASSNHILPSLVRIIVDLGDGGIGLGSGIIIDPNGLILTNAHVAVHPIRSVLLQNGQSLPATLIGTDTLADLAIIRVALTGLPAADIGQSSALQGGDIVVGVGYTPYFPSPPTTRVGAIIVSEPDAQNYTPIRYIVETNAILPGDSGGPLVNTAGQLVGINSQSVLRRTSLGILPLYSRSIAIDGAMPIIRQIISTGASIQRPYLGAIALPWTQEDATRMELPYTPGLLVVDVDHRSPAAKAGVREGQVIVAVDGMQTLTVGSLIGILAKHSIGDTITVTTVNPLGGARTVSIVLGGSPGTA